MDLPAEELPPNAIILETEEESFAKSLACSYFFSETMDIASFNSVEEVICIFIDITNDLEFADLLFMNMY